MKVDKFEVLTAHVATVVKQIRQDVRAWRLSKGEAKRVARACEKLKTECDRLCGELADYAPGDGG